MLACQKTGLEGISPSQGIHMPFHRNWSNLFLKYDFS